LINCLTKAMAKTNSKGFQNLSKNFPNISTARLKEGISWDHKSEKSWKMKPS
jgi:hypothetical protein